MPFVTEAIWEHLNDAAPERGLDPQVAGKFAMRAPWPESIASHHDEAIERQFAEFQEVVSAIRRIRASQNIAPRETVPVSIRCSDSSRKLLEPMTTYFEGLAGAEIIELGPNAKPFETDAPLALTSIDIDVHVDLEKFIDAEAELTRLEKLMTQVVKQIVGIEQKLNNENFVSRAPEDVVARERDRLSDLKRQRNSIDQDIARLRSKLEEN
jgi:valyl-tRNA synthetase